MSLVVKTGVPLYLSWDLRTVQPMVAVGDSELPPRRNVLKRITASFCFNGAIKRESRLLGLSVSRARSRRPPTSAALEERVGSPRDRTGFWK